MKITVALAAIAACSLASPVLAAPLLPEDAVVFLLAGVQDKGVSPMLNMIWDRKSVGYFEGGTVGTPQAANMIMQVTAISGCEYQARGELVVEGQTVKAYTAVYDFSEVSDIVLVRPVMAGVVGSDNFCLSDTHSMCSKIMELAVPTAADRYKQVYDDFRRDHCPEN